MLLMKGSIEKRIGAQRFNTQLKKSSKVS